MLGSVLPLAWRGLGGRNAAVPSSNKAWLGRAWPGRGGGLAGLGDRRGRAGPSRGELEMKNLMPNIKFVLGTLRTKNKVRFGHFEEHFMLGPVFFV